MSEIDWSKAPADATHANGAGVFLRENKSGSVSNFDNGKWIMTSSTIADFNHGYIFERPTTPSWSGGCLPPVGVVCMANGYQVVIVAHHCNGIHAIYAESEVDGLLYYGEPNEFRPIRTPEQIAADEREAAILDMERICRIGDFGSGGLAALYDAGYRKQ